MIPNVLVPGLEPGVTALTVNVDGLSATAIFEVTDSGEAGGVSTPILEGLEPLGEILDRVFYFNNSTKEWSFYDPRSAFADVNTLIRLVEGEIYWLKVTEDSRTTLNSRFRNLLCFEEDCWNLLIW